MATGTAYSINEIHNIDYEIDPETGHSILKVASDSSASGPTDVTIADGGHVTFGAKADGIAASPTETNTFMALFKRLGSSLEFLITLFPTSLGARASDDSFAVTLATNDAAVVGIGAPADAAATGNGSSIGILKQLRVLLTAGLPASLGPKAGTASLSVVNATLGTIKSGELQGSASALQLPNITCSLVKLKALGSNAGNVYLGGSGVTVANGTTDTTSGLELRPGEETGLLPISNLNLLYRICDNAGDDLTYLAME